MLTYLCPRPCVVDTREAVLIYVCPKPLVVDASEAVLIYILPRPWTVDFRDSVLTYPSVPKATKLDFRFAPYERLSILAVKVVFSVSINPPP